MKIRGIKSLCRDCGFELLVLFGSAAKGNSNDANDIDLAVKLIKGKKASKLDLLYKLEGVLGEKQIDIVVLTVDTDPLLLNEIFKGKCMYEKKKGTFEKEKLRAWKLYLDTEKIRNMRSKYLKDFVKRQLMSPDIIKKKLESITTYLNDLLPYKKITFNEFMLKHYEIERILELLVMTASDIIFHILSDKGEPTPISYKAAFLRAGELKIINKNLSKNLSLSAGLRNILAHEYEEIDYKIVHKSIASAVRDFTSFVKALS